MHSLAVLDRVAVTLGLIAVMGALAPWQRAEAQTSRRAFGSDIASTTLDNGLQVVVVHNPGVPLVTLHVVLRAGAAIQTSDALQGIPHLLEHMLFRSGDDDGWPFARSASDLGASWNGTTSSEAVHYYLTVPSRHFGKGLELLSDLIRKPDFTAKAIEAERKVVQGELERRASEPSMLLHTTSELLLWEGPGWEIKNAGGNLLALMQATPDLLTSVHRKYYVPNNAALIISGNVTDSAAMAHAARVFRGWKRGPDPSAGSAPRTIPPLPRIKRKIVTGDVRTVTIVASWQGPSVTTDRSGTYAADVFAGLVNQPLSGTQARLVDSGLLESVWLSYHTASNVGPIQLTAVTSPDRAQAAIEAVGAELSRLVQPDYFSAADLRLARKRQYVQQHYRFESAATAGRILADFWASADLDYFLAYTDSLDAQDVPQVRRFVDTYLKGKPLTVAVLLPPDVWRASSTALDRALGAWRAP